MLNSNYKEITRIELPFKNRQHYMHSFDLNNISVPKGFEDYLPIVEKICRIAGVLKGEAHLTVDEKLVLKGATQRKPKPHVDGCFYEQNYSWGHGGWNHTCNNIGLNGYDYKRMPVIVASSVQGCRAWKGVYNATPKDDGDLSHLALPEGKLLTENMAYLLSADCIHESLPMTETLERTFVRIALPVDFKFEE